MWVKFHIGQDISSGRGVHGGLLPAKEVQRLHALHLEMWGPGCWGGQEEGGFQGICKILFPWCHLPRAFILEVINCVKWLWGWRIGMGTIRPHALLKTHTTLIFKHTHTHRHIHTLTHTHTRAVTFWKKSSSNKFEMTQFILMNSNKFPPPQWSWVCRVVVRQTRLYSSANVSLRGCKLAGESTDLLSLWSKTAALYKVDKQLC